MLLQNNVKIVSVFQCIFIFSKRDVHSFLTSPSLFCIRLYFLDTNPVLDDVDGNDYDENLSGIFFQVFHNEFIF
jgi:hypothetical protein